MDKLWYPLENGISFWADKKGPLKWWEGMRGLNTNYQVKETYLKKHHMAWLWINDCGWGGSAETTEDQSMSALEGGTGGPRGTGRALSQSVHTPWRSCSAHFSMPMGYTLRETIDSQMHDMSEPAHWWAWYKHTSGGGRYKMGAGCSHMRNHLYFLLKLSVNLKLVLNKNH